MNLGRLQPCSSTEIVLCQDILTQECVLVDLDDPILATYRDLHEKLYLALCTDYYISDSWLVMPIDESALLDMLTNKITMKELFESASECNLCDSNGYSIHYQKVPHKFLPDAGAYFGNCNKHLQNYITCLQSRVESREQSSVCGQNTKED